jgi:phage shock protein C
MAKLLKRTASDKRIAGVCGGLGRYFDMDPVIWRIIFLVSIFFGGLGLITYFIIWLVVPYGEG